MVSKCVRSIVTVWPPFVVMTGRMIGPFRDADLMEGGEIKVWKKDKRTIISKAHHSKIKVGVQQVISE